MEGCLLRMPSLMSLCRGSNAIRGTEEHTFNHILGFLVFICALSLAAKAGLPWISYL